MKKIIILSSLCLAVVFSPSCKKKKKTEEPAPATTTTGATPTPTAISVSSTPQVKFDVDGTTKSYIADGGDYNSDRGSSLSIGTPTSSGSWSSGISKISPYKDIVDIEKGTLTYSATGHPDNTMFKNYFAVGSYSYSPAGLSIISGMTFAFWDDSNVKWSTELGTGVQTGSAFTIVEIAEENITDYDIKVYATFNCKVYDGNGNSKTITNGKYVGSFGNI
jgi:hypothetical protein